MIRKTRRTNAYRVKREIICTSRVKRENPNMEGGDGGENTKTGDTTTSMGTKTTAGPTAGTYSTGGTKS